MIYDESGDLTPKLWERLLAMSKPKVPTIRELLTDLDITEYKVELLAERVEAVLKLHRPGADHANREDFCQHCGEDWPCPTVRALNGEKV